MDALSTPPKRNRGYEDTHRLLIDTAVRLISEQGSEALSLAALARAAGINRTTIYYHFDSREALLHAVSLWASEQLAEGMDATASQPDRIAHISRFVLGNPELIAIWINEFISGGDIRESYAPWDALVVGTQMRLDEEFPDEKIDAEVWCTMLICASVIGPRVFRNSVRPDLSHETVVKRFLKEHQRVLQRDRLSPPKKEN